MEQSHEYLNDLLVCGCCWIRIRIVLIPKGKLLWFLFLFSSVSDQNDQKISRMSFWYRIFMSEVHWASCSINENYFLPSFIMFCDFCYPTVSVRGSPQALEAPVTAFFLFCVLTWGRVPDESGSHCDQNFMQSSHNPVTMHIWEMWRCREEAARKRKCIADCTLSSGHRRCVNGHF